MNIVLSEKVLRNSIAVIKRDRVITYLEVNDPVFCPHLSGNLRRLGRFLGLFYLFLVNYVTYHY